MTLEKALQVCKHIGVTRLAENTSMDRLGILNYSAVLPERRTIFGYTVDAKTCQQAKASALMESIERYCSLPSGNMGRAGVRGTIKELTKSYALIHPDDIIEPLNFHYQEDMKMEFLQGFDMLNERVAYQVPAPLGDFSSIRLHPASNFCFIIIKWSCVRECFGRSGLPCLV